MSKERLAASLPLVTIRRRLFAALRIHALFELADRRASCPAARHQNQNQNQNQTAIPP
jgi:hypothetical protein